MTIPIILHRFERINLLRYGSQLKGLNCLSCDAFLSKLLVKLKPCLRACVFGLNFFSDLAMVGFIRLSHFTGCALHH